MSDDPQAGGGTPRPMPEASAQEAAEAAAPENVDASAFSDIATTAPANGERQATAAAGAASRLDLVLDLPVRLSVELGRTEIRIREVVGLGRGSIVELDRVIGEPMDVRVNGILIGRGEIVVINEERLGLRFTEVVSQAERAKGLG